MFSKFKVNSNPRNWKQLFFTMYALARTLDADQPFDKWKEKSTPGTYLGPYPTHTSTLGLVHSLSNGRV